MLSREAIRDEASFPLAQCFRSALEFLSANAGADDWLLPLECFDPHEPFFSTARFRDGLNTCYQGPTLDWPPYCRFNLTAPEAAELRANYFALVRMCDQYLGGCSTTPMPTTSGKTPR